MAGAVDCCIDDSYPVAILQGMLVPMCWQCNNMIGSCNILHIIIHGIKIIHHSGGSDNVCRRSMSLGLGRGRVNQKPVLASLCVDECGKLCKPDNAREVNPTISMILCICSVLDLHKKTQTESTRTRAPIGDQNVEL